MPFSNISSAQSLRTLLGYTDPPAVANWTWVNQGTATASDVDNGIFLSGPSAANNLRVLVKSIPSAPYTIIAAIHPLLFASADKAGMILRDSASGKLITFGPSADGDGTVLSQNWNSATSWASTNVVKECDSMNTVIWLKIVDDATSRYYYMSYDGVNWILLASGARTDFAIPDQVGFYAYINNIAGAGMTLLSWEES